MKDLIFSSFAEQRGHAGMQSSNGSTQLRIAVIGQSNFAADVLELLVEGGYNVVGVFTIPDKGNREDVLATTAKRHNIPVFKFTLWRRKGVVLPDVLQQYQSVQVGLYKWIKWIDKVHLFEEKN